ncbi:MAG: GspE/PulE family protein [Candidatus Woesebacteria bacterium]
MPLATPTDELPRKIERYNGVDDQTLYRLLLENGSLSEKQLQDADSAAKTNKQPLYETLLRQDLIADENLGKLIADHLKLPFVVLSKISIPDEFLHIIPESLAKRHSLMVFGRDERGIKIALSNPEIQIPVTFIAKKTGESVQIYFATRKDIEETLSLYKKGLQKTFSELVSDQIRLSKTSLQKEVPASKVVDLFIEYAYTSKASDIHIEPQELDTVVRFRIDGVMHDVLHVPKTFHAQIVSRIKVLAKLKTDEHFSAQDGKLQVRLEEDDIDIRVSIVPVIKGENVVMRLLSSKSRQFSLLDLGMSERDLEKVRHSYTRSFGMILSTGPTGSGKTTSIYAILKILNVRERNISTIENPVEYDIDGIGQIQVNPKTNLTFADGLRSILRQDPDIIFVGEIRDNETADIAINSAMTGHLVLSTLHTSNAATTLPRLIDMHIEPFLVSSTVNLVIGQRLVRKICEKCKVSFAMPREELRSHVDIALIEKYFGSEAEIRLYHGKGCSVCNQTGYVGRIGVFEVLVISPAISLLINQKVSADVIAQKAAQEGMTTMFEDGIDKVQRGITTLEEVLRATKT